MIGNVLDGFFLINLSNIPVTLRVEIDFIVKKFVGSFRVDGLVRATLGFLGGWSAFSDGFLLVAWPVTLGGKLPSNFFLAAACWLMKALLLLSYISA